MRARASVITLIATAPATVTFVPPFSPDFASGVVVVFGVFPRCVFAFPSWSFAFWLTSLFELSVRRPWSPSCPRRP
jgi:hypothetical protein